MCVQVRVCVCACAWVCHGWRTIQLQELKWVSETRQASRSSEKGEVIFSRTVVRSAAWRRPQPEYFHLQWEAGSQRLRVSQQLRGRMSVGSAWLFRVRLEKRQEQVLLQTLAGVAEKSDAASVSSHSPSGPSTAIIAEPISQQRRNWALGLKPFNMSESWNLSEPCIKHI